MASKGFWTAVLTIGAFLINPALGAVVGLSAITAWAVFSGDAKPKPDDTYDVAVPREKFNQSLPDVPEEVRAKLHDRVTRELEEASREILNGKPGNFSITREGNKLIAKIYEQGQDQAHQIEYNLPVRG